MNTDILKSFLTNKEVLARGNVTSASAYGKSENLSASPSVFLLSEEMTAEWIAGGESLPDSLRLDLEALFQTNLKDIKIHESEAPSSINALAFAYGEHLHFTPGFFSPFTPDGRKILIHEITHFIQQKIGTALNPFGCGTVILENHQLEIEADLIANGELLPTHIFGGHLTKEGQNPYQGRVVQCIHYLNVSELGHSYKYEQGTHGHRYPGSLAITGRENLLKTAIIEYNNARPKRPLPTPPGGIAPPPQPPVDQIRLNNAIANMNKQREWLTREGFVVGIDGSIDWPQSAKTVVYDNQLLQQDMTKLSAKNGRLYVGAQPFDTTGLVTHFSGPGYAIYVMSQQGNIHVSSHSLGHRHHSSLLAGGNTAGAGEIKTDALGNLLWLSNKSGHYQPSPIHLNQVIHQLTKLGIPPTYEVKEFDGVNPAITHASASGYLNDIKNRDDSPDYELQKLLQYMVHMTDPILNLNDWEWRVNPSLPPGVYKRHTFQMIPHKVVRQWFKARGLVATTKTQSGSAR